MVKTKDIPEDQLMDLGFVETAPKLWKKILSDNTELYRDYRRSQASSYAYFDSRSIPAIGFREVIAIEKIEKELTRIKSEKNSLAKFIR